VSPDLFFGGDGYAREKAAIQNDRRIRAAAAVTSTDIDDVTSDAITRVLEQWDSIVAGCPADRDVVSHLIHAALFRARDAARSAKNGYHKQAGNSVRSVRQSDREDTKSFDSLFGRAVPKVYAGPFLASLPPEVQEFLRELCRQRQDLFEGLILAFKDSRTVNHDKRKQLRYAYKAWLESRTKRSPEGKIPNPKKVEPATVPPHVQRLPPDAEILDILEEGFIHWSSPEMMQNKKKRVVYMEVDDVSRVDEYGQGRPETIAFVVTETDTYSPAWALAA
jgi:hypothetical protein